MTGIFIDMFPYADEILDMFPHAGDIHTAASGHVESVVKLTRFGLRRPLLRYWECDEKSQYKNR